MIVISGGRSDSVAVPSPTLPPILVGTGASEPRPGILVPSILSVRGEGVVTSCVASARSAARPSRLLSSGVTAVR